MDEKLHRQIKGNIQENVALMIWAEVGGKYIFGITISHLLAITS